MVNKLTAVAMLTGLILPAMADDSPKPQPEATAAAVELRTTPDELPDGIRKFNGMLVGRLAAKDVEKGTFVVQIDAVPRVWRASKAENPRSIVGKTVEVNGVFGRFLDVLVVMKKGETVEFEARHDDGNRLTFPGELLRKVAPYDLADYPMLPEAFRGFQGTVVADVVKKDPETLELIVKVDRVLDTGKDSQAKESKSIEGKQVMLAGFWQRREAYHDLKVGDRIEVGVKHVALRSELLTVDEFIRKTGERPPSDRAEVKREVATSAGGLNEQLHGFRGILVGRLVSKDVERGTFSIAVDAVPRVWNNNQASNPKGFLGEKVDVEGVHGKLLDALVVARIGETMEFGAMHDDGDRLRVGEVLRKVAPVKPGDYPELPDDFRGFKGTVVAKVVSKDDQSLALIVQIEEIKMASPNSRAKHAATIVGKQVMLAGFYRRKDDFHELHVGDTIECGVEHPQPLSDHLNVIEDLKKVK